MSLHASPDVGETRQATLAGGLRRLVDLLARHIADEAWAGQLNDATPEDDDDPKDPSQNPS